MANETFGMANEKAAGEEATDIIWEPLIRDSAAAESAVEMEEADWDPLSAAVAAKEQKMLEAALAKSPAAAAKQEPFDPLSRHVAAATSSDPLSAATDPLSAAAANRPSVPTSPGVSTGGAALVLSDGAGDQGESVSCFVPWNTRKTSIVQNFTTTGTIQMPSFVSVEVAKAGRGAGLQARVQAIEDTADDEVSMVRYNAREYVTNMTTLNEELARAWNNEERVKALKMAIECARLLANTSTPQFYPSLFVLVTEILDTFGSLVFERIKQKGLTAEGRAKKRVQVSFDTCAGLF
jgi:hypothetical protein